MIVKDGEFAVLGFFFGDERLVESFHTTEVIGEGGGGLVWASFHNRPIRFLHGVVREKCVHAFQRLAGARENHHTRGGAVQTMGDTQKDVARFVVLLFEIGLESVGQGHIAGFVSLHKVVASLVDNEQVVVFKENIHSRKRLKKERRCGYRLSRGQ